jgi:hypothetical protein
VHTLGTGGPAKDTLINVIVGKVPGGAGRITGATVAPEVMSDNCLYARAAGSHQKTDDAGHEVHWPEGRRARLVRIPAGGAP